MESPGPGSEGPGSQLSREQLIEYVKKQKSRIKTLESQLASTEVPTDHHDNSETVQLRAFITELREAKSADETKILDLEQAVAALIEKLNNSSAPEPADFDIEKPEFESADAKLKKMLGVSKAVIAAKSAEVAELELKYSSAQASLTSTIEGLQKELESKQLSEEAAAADALVFSQRLQSELEGTIATLSTQLEESRAVASKWEAESKQEMSINEHVTTDISCQSCVDLKATLESITESSRTEIDHLKQLNESLLEKTSNLNNLLSESNKAEVALKNSLDELRKVDDDLRVRSAENSKEFADLQSAMASSDEKCSELTLLVQDLQQQLLEMAENQEAPNSVVVGSESRVAELEALVMTLQQSLQQTEMDRDQLQLAVRGLEARQTESEGGPDATAEQTLELLMSDLREQLSVKTDDLEKSQLRADDVLKAKDVALEAEQVKVKKLATKLKLTMKQVTDKTAELEKTTTELSAVSTSLASTKERVSVLEGEVQELSVKAGQLIEVQDELKTANAKISDLVSKEKALQKKVKQLSDKSSGLDEVLEKLSASEREVEELKGREKDLSVKLAKATKAASVVEELTENLRVANESIVELESREKAQQVAAKKYKAEKSAEMKRLNEHIVTAEESIAGLEKIRITSQAEVKSLTAQLQEALSTREVLEAGGRELQSYRVQVKELSAANADLQKKLQDALTDVEWAIKDAEAARDEMAARKADFEATESTEVTLLRQRIDEVQRIARERKKELAGANQEVAKLRATLEEERATMEAAVEQAKSVVAEVAGSKSKDKDRELRAKDKELKAVQSKLAATEAAKEDLKEQLEQLNTDMAARDKAIENLRASNATVKADLERVRLSAETEKKALEDKLELMNDKSRKMKALLSKTKTVLQEKEKKEAEASDPADLRLKRCSVHTILSVSLERETKQSTWYLLKDEEPVPEESSSSVHTVNGYVWVSEETFKAWEAKGTTVAGRRPVPLDEYWAARKADSDKKLKTIEGEKRELQAQLEASVQAFNVYKARAQAALKKVSGEDKSERKRVSMVEETELERATERVLQLEEELAMLTQEVRGLEAARAASESRGADAAARVLDLLADSEVLQSKLAAAAEDLEAAVAAKQEETAKRLEAECYVASLRTQLDIVTSKSASSTSEGFPSGLSRDVSFGDRDEGGGGGSRTNSTRLVLYERTDSEFKENTLSLRQENAALSAERIELKSMVALSHEQIALLKENIRELELRLVREVEFNSSSHRINAEYLMNVLKNFLLSEAPSERARLAGVLCSMLHVRPDETKIIQERWAEKKRSGGLAGWFMGAPRTAATAEESDVPDDHEEVESS